MTTQGAHRAMLLRAAGKALLAGLRSAALGAFVWLTPLAFAAADDSARGLAVVYPDIGEPYRSVFTAIIEGIEDRLKTRVSSYAIGTPGNAQELAQELRRRDVRAVILLGRNGLKLASLLDRQVGVVAGGVLSVPEGQAQGLSVLSLAPDPALLFAQLKLIVPGARRVVVVYDPRQNAWLLRLAREAARAQGLELAAYEAEDLKAAIRLYRDTLASADPKRDVLWLPQDATTVEDSAVVPLVMREAWNQNLAVFSSNVSHVKRGALFSLYPNNQALGRSLASWALGHLASPATPAARGILPLRDVLVAVNTRTAQHLGLHLDDTPQRFDLVFPEP
jgi:putative ABC transport system substrate-binding protein